jgi:hypothetical protein
MLMRSSKNVCLSIFSGKNIEFSEKCLFVDFGEKISNFCENVCFFCFLVKKYRIFGKHDRDYFESVKPLFIHRSNLEGGGKAPFNYVPYNHYNPPAGLVLLVNPPLPAQPQPTERLDGIDRYRQRYRSTPRITAFTQLLII